MAPLLSIPTAVKELLYRYGIVYMIPILAIYGFTIAMAALVSKKLIPRVRVSAHLSAPFHLHFFLSAYRPPSLENIRGRAV
jgi:amino acid permease